MSLSLVEIPEQTTSSDEIDEEILEIFLEECEEVLEEIRGSYADWKKNPSDKEALQTVRRAFHTLKGSGRLVGAMSIGELGWWFENLLNRIIDGTLSVNSELFRLIDQVEDMVPPLIEQFKNAEPPFYEALLLMSQAKHYTESKGAEFGDFISPAESGLPSLSGEAPGEAEEIIAEEIPAPEAPAPVETVVEILEEAVSEAPPPVVAEEIAVEEAVEIVEEAAETEVDPTLLKIFKNEAAGHLKTLKNFILDSRQKLPCPLTEQLFRTFHTLNGSSRSMGLPNVAALAGAAEKYVRLSLDCHQPLHKEQLALLVESGKLLNSLLSKPEQPLPPVYEKILNSWQDSYDSLAAEIITEHAEEPEELPEDLLAEPEPAPQPAPPPAPAKPAPAPIEEVGEAADEFMEIFLEEAEEILETSQSLVGRWLTSPNNMPLLKELQRELHTLKGGSRMVGITIMGDLSHQLESVLTRIVEGHAQSNPRFQELVQESLDELAAMLEAVREGVALEPATDLIQQIAITIEGGGAAAPSAATKKATKPASEEATPAEKAEPQAAETAGGEESEGGGEAEERVRVRAGLIDKLTNLAGEMSILRAHMEQQQGTVKNNLAEMEQTVMRLRDQLRRLEIETEVQIISHFGNEPAAAEEDDEDFDPLEMDRFSGMQQLSRSLLETVNDLQNIQENLKNVTRHSDSLLIQQSRIGGDLQDSIMRTRMVPFSQISPRLQRIARLTAKELKKQVKFGINDEEMEFERTVLNRIVAPLEHMLRNAIGHGVEPPDERKKNDKQPMAEVYIELLQEGAEFIIKMRDDGAGINVDAIRKKAVDRGMLKPGESIPEQDLMQFILEPAFSTAEKVTQVSGRGVGMDIVNSEVKQLGGTLEIFSERGKGTTFEIRLPMSLTISKALLVHLAEETMAVPLANVDAVLRVSRDQVQPPDSQEISYYHYMDQAYRIAHLADMLGFPRASTDMPLLPVLLVRSGDIRYALLVDGIEGSKEVVVKSVGPQLSSIRWLAGATILGDGRVVIILDVLTLMRACQQRQAAAVMVEAPSAEIEAALEKAKVKVPTVMVVDDSITVRKVTARFLKRQGMEVITAKDGLDAVSQLQETVPDVMLLDVEMPRMDGFEVATQVRNDEHLKDLPIIMITSRTGAKHRERATKIGINRHLGKPFNENELLENIKQLLEERA